TPAPQGSTPIRSTCPLTSGPPPPRDDSAKLQRQLRRLLLRAPTGSAGPRFSWCSSRSLELEAGAGGHHGWLSGVDGVDDLAGVDPLQICRSDPEVGMPELALGDGQRDAFACHLDGVSVP